MSFRIRLKEPNVTELARESAQPNPWTSTRAELSYSSGQSDEVKPSSTGLVEASPSGGPSQAKLEHVWRDGPHRRPIDWNLVGHDHRKLTQGTTASVALSTRLRFSMWSFNTPFIRSLYELDKELLKLVNTAYLDDLSLVHTIAWKEHTDGVRFTSKWTVSDAQLAELIQELHRMRVQVLAGYAIGDEKDYSEYFVRWLDKAKEPVLDAHASAIVDFLDKRKLPFDGVGFDLEMSGLRRHDESPAARRGQETCEKLTYLYAKLSELMAERNGIVTYATAPFTTDGEGQSPWINAQPYRMAKAAPNLIARPMTDSEKYGVVDKDTIMRSIACALSPTDKGGGGLHPSQLQIPITPSKMAMEELVTQHLRPNRAGLVIYRLPRPADREATKKMLRDCTQWHEQWLNKYEPLPGTSGQPLQVPLGPPKDWKHWGLDLSPNPYS